MIITLCRAAARGIRLRRLPCVWKVERTYEERKFVKDTAEGTGKPEGTVPNVGTEWNDGGEETGPADGGLY